MKTKDVSDRLFQKGTKFAMKATGMTMSTASRRRKDPWKMTLRELALMKEAEAITIADVAIILGEKEQKMTGENMTAVRLDAYELRELCIRENWFTHGNNEQYSRLFRMNNCWASIHDMALVIWICSRPELSVRDIEQEIKEEIRRKACC